MRQKFIKSVTEDGSVYYNKSRYLTVHSVQGFPGRYIFKETSGKVVEPTDLELELYNEYQSGGMKVTNGWLTFLGIMALVNLIGLIILIGKIASVSSSYRSLY